MYMNPQERIQLGKMIDANQAKDYTEDIRKKKHSHLIRCDVQTLLNLKKDNALLAETNPEQFDNLCVTQCQFLFNNYTDIFNKVKKEEIDLSILNKLLNVLKQIEGNKIDQHEGSVSVGKLLKQIYIDSALKKSENLDKKYGDEEDANEPIPISWHDFKRMKN
jgi:hypothetical protein